MMLDPQLLIDEWGRRSPDALELARVVSIASRVEPELLRKARLKLLAPDVDAGAEADLWFSPLVQSSTSLAFTFIPAISDLLRRELAKSQESLRRAWEIVEEVHAHAPAAIKLEERVTWRILEAKPDAYEAVENELMSVVSAIVNQNRTGLARWALRAVPRLPKEARETKAAQTLLITAAAHVGGWHLLQKQVESNNLSAAFINHLKVVLPTNLPQVRVGVRLLEESAEFVSSGVDPSYVVEFSSPPSDDKSDLIKVPGTTPLLLEVSWSEKAGQQVRNLSLYQGRVETVKVPASTVTIRTAAGDVYTLSEDVEKAAALAPDALREKLARIPRPPKVGFVTRHLDSGLDIVEEVMTMLAPMPLNIVRIWGKEGSGKTTVAAELARRLIDSRDDRLVWLSAEGRSDFNLNSVMDGIALQFERSDLRTLGAKTKFHEVRKFLSFVDRPIIFLDDFEILPLKEQTRCLNFLKRSECRTVVISRDEGSQPAQEYIFSLKGMSVDDAREFVQRTIRLSSASSIFTDAQRLEELIRVCRGNPLTMQLVVALIEFTQNPTNVLAEMSDHPDYPLTHVFKLSFNLPELGDDGRAALLSLALFVPSASKEALAEVAGMGQDVDRLNRAVSNLRRLELISEEGRGRIKVGGFVRGLLHSIAPIPDEGSIEERFIEYFLTFAEKHSEATASDYDALEAEVENLLDSLDMAEELERWEDLTRICLALQRFFEVRGYWDEALRRNAQARKAARAAKKRLGVLPRLHQAEGNIYLRREEFSKAESAFRSILRSYAKQPLNVEVEQATRQLGSIAFERRDWKRAESFYSEALAISRNLKLGKGIADNLHNLAIVAQFRGRQNQAVKLYEESLAISQRLGDQRSIAISLHQLGVVALKQKRYPEARNFFEQSLNTKRQLGDRNGMADTLHQLGVLLGTLGEKEQAERVLRQALSIYLQLGSPSAGEVDADLANLIPRAPKASKRSAKKRKIAKRLPAKTVTRKSPRKRTAKPAKKAAKKSSAKKSGRRKGAASRPSVFSRPARSRFRRGGKKGLARRSSFALK